MGASVILGGDEEVFSTILSMKQNRTHLLPSTLLHICRPHSGHLKLQRAWDRWIRKRDHHQQGHQPVATTVAQSLTWPAPSLYPQPAELHLIATPLWLQLCVEDKHHYPQKSFVFFEPPLGNAYTPLLFRYRPLSSAGLKPRRLSVLLLGCRGGGASGLERAPPRCRGAEDYNLWQAGIEHYLGGSMFSIRKLHTPPLADWQMGGDAATETEYLRQYARAEADTLHFEPFSNFQGITSDLRVHDRPAELPDVIVCLHGQTDVMSFVASIGSTNMSQLHFNVQTTLQTLILLSARIPFVTFRWLNECYVRVRGRSPSPSPSYAGNCAGLRPLLIERETRQGARYLDK